MASLRLDGIRHRILEPVSLSLAAGELVFISGPSGSGKSLLLRAIADLDKNEGEAWVDGAARSEMPAPEWRRRVGLLPAESHWWAESVGEHLPRSDTQADGGSASVQALLGRLGFGADVLGWSISRLSTGERQRLALARLIANEPQALLLDEATANLDPSNREQVEALVENYRREKSAAVIWVGHDAEQRQRLGGRQLTIRNARLERDPAA